MRMQSGKRAHFNTLALGVWKWLWTIRGRFGWINGRFGGDWLRSGRVSSLFLLFGNVLGARGGEIGGLEVIRGDFGVVSYPSPYDNYMTTHMTTI